MRICLHIDKISSEEREAEILAFGMRTVDGWNWRQFMDRVGIDGRMLRGEALDRLARQGLVEIDDEGVRPTARGLLFNDEIVMELL